MHSTTEHGEMVTMRTAETYLTRGPRQYVDLPADGVVLRY